MDSESAWAPYLDIQISPVLAEKPTPITIIFGINPAMHTSMATTCMDINDAIFEAYNGALPNTTRCDTLLTWRSTFGIKVNNFQGIHRYQMYAADPAFCHAIRAVIKLPDNTLIKFQYGGLEGIPRIIPEKPSEQLQLRDLIAEHVDGPQKAWKVFAITSMQPNISRHSIHAMVRSSDLIVAASYRKSRVHNLTTCRIFVEDTFTTMKDVFDEIPEELLYAEGDRNIPSISMTNAPGWDLPPNASRRQKQGGQARNTGNPNDDTTSAFWEAMGMQHPPGALK
eukprot:scaffold81405_cov29-Attheya_sp.AAC.1